MGNIFYYMVLQNNIYLSLSEAPVQVHVQIKQRFNTRKQLRLKTQKAERNHYFFLLQMTMNMIKPWRLSPWLNCASARVKESDNNTILKINLEVALIVLCLRYISAWNTHVNYPHYSMLNRNIFPPICGLSCLSSHPQKLFQYSHCISIFKTLFIEVKSPRV